ncbi:MAG TPA: hypothetical protein H9831_11985 [Candidatus Eisenbergiella pullistercoris]|uniref:Uncharacterized protein n=1 Tax=Candidatus Eisenbergiella pullistercoris TaxID=2838555 RepID=A0A9D1YRI8_9FIRM|nr:hypothetical protein [Candidatus Eisenbergiella pullistercoris]
MINEKKVAVMTRMAAYEAGNGKKDRAVCSFFRSDFVGFQLLKTWIAVTAAFCILAGIWLLYRLDEITAIFYAMDVDALLELGKDALAAYGILCGGYLLTTWLAAHVVYAKAHKASAAFDRMLTEIDGSEEEEE